MKKIKPAQLIKVIVAFVVIVLILWFFKDIICPKCFVLSNQDASVVTSMNYGSGSGSISGVVTDIYPSITVSTLSQLDSITNSISFYNSAYRSNFYKIIKDSIDNNGYADVYFDSTYNSETNIGKNSSNGKYVNDTIITQDSSCSVSNSVQSFSEISNRPSPAINTPELNMAKKAKKGICGLISIAHSLIYKLKTALPSGFGTISTTTIYKLPTNLSSGSGSGSNSGSGTGVSKPYLVYRSWIILYLELLAKGVMEPDGSIPLNKYVEIYKKFYGENVEVNQFHFTIPPFDKVNFDKLFRLFNLSKTDCTLITVWSEKGVEKSHASHIRKIWYSWEDNSINIEMTNTLDQGDGPKGGFNNIPIDPGTITIKIKENFDKSISVSVKSDKKPSSSKVKKEKNDKIMEDLVMKQLKQLDGTIGFRIYCVTIKE